jgi:hypothetical protein
MRLEKGFFRNPRETAVVGTNNCRRSFAIEKKCDFSEIITFFEKSRNTNGLIIVIYYFNLALTLSYKIKIVWLISLLHDNVVWLSHVRNYILNIEVNEFTLSTKDWVFVKSVYENVSHNQRFQTWT